MKIACLETFASEFVCFVRLTTDTDRKSVV